MRKKTNANWFHGATGKRLTTTDEMLQVEDDVLPSGENWNNNSVENLQFKEGIEVLYKLFRNEGNEKCLSDISSNQTKNATKKWRMKT